MVLIIIYLKVLIGAVRKWITKCKWFEKRRKKCVYVSCVMLVEAETNHRSTLCRAELLFVCQEYQKPLLEPQSWILSPKKVRQIFYRLQEIHQCHSMFQIALACRVAEWDHSEKIGDLFVASVSPHFCLLLTFLLFSLITGLWPRLSVINMNSPNPSWDNSGHVSLTSPGVSKADKSSEVIWESTKQIKNAAQSSSEPLRMHRRRYVRADFRFEHEGGQNCEPATGILTLVMIKARTRSWQSEFPEQKFKLSVACSLQLGCEGSSC